MTNPFAELRETLDHNPRKVRVRMMLADMMEKSGDIEAAKAELEWVLEMEPNNVAALNKLAQTALNEGDFPAARRHFDHAAELAPDKPGPQFGYGLACASMGDHREALAAFAAVQQMNPNLTSVALRIADAHMALKQPEDALRALQAVRRTRNSSALHIRSGDVYLSMGRFAQAVEEYRAAVLHQPELIERDPGLKSLLEGGGNPEVLATKVQERLASISDEMDDGTGDARQPRRRLNRWRGKLRQAG